jgi:hypothetical protein
LFKHANNDIPRIEIKCRRCGTVSIYTASRSERDRPSDTERQKAAEPRERPP